MARPENRDRIVELLLAMHVADAGHGGRHRRPNEAELLGGLADEALAREEATWVAEADGAVVGVCSVLLGDEADWAQPSTSLTPIAYLGLLSVDPAARRGGIGRALSERAHARAKEAGGHGDAPGPRRLVPAVRGLLAPAGTDPSGPPG